MMISRDYFFIAGMESESPHWKLMLAIAVTVLSMLIAGIAGWERGGFFLERLMWTAFAIVVVLATDLLPTMLRRSSWARRVVVASMWMICFVLALYSHLTFFLIAQQHRAAKRFEEMVSNVSQPLSTSSSRDPLAIAQDREKAEKELSALKEHRCVPDCSNWRIHRTALLAELDKLDVETKQANRYQQDQERQVEQIAEAKKASHDPVVAYLVGLTGMTIDQIDLLLCVLGAIGLEGFACLMWLSYFESRPTASIPGASAVASVSDSHVHVQTLQQDSQGLVTVLSEVDRAGMKPPGPKRKRGPNLTEAELKEKVAQAESEIRSGKLDPTVEGLRVFIGCGQKKASAVRNQFIEQGLIPA